MIHEHILYDGEVTILFNDQKHRYLHLGEPVPSSTTITSMKNKDLGRWYCKTVSDYWQVRVQPNVALSRAEISRIAKEAKDAPYAYRDMKADIGSEIHDWIQAWIVAQMTGADLETPLPVDNKALEGIRKFIDWTDDRDIEWLFAERVIYSRALNYAGTADFGAIIDGVLTLGDWKTGKWVYPDHGMQAASYVGALQEELKLWRDGDPQRMIVHLSPEKKLQVYDEKRIEQEVSGHDLHGDRMAFLGCRGLYDWDQKNRYLWKTRSWK